MAVTTAGQGARPHPAFSNAQHAVESHRGSPQSGGDVGGPKRFLAGKGIPTSGGRADDRQGTVDHAHDQGSKKLYLGKAFENAQRVSFMPKKGNSEGRAETHTKTETNATITKAAAGRLTKNNSADSKVMGHDEFTSQPFRKSSGAFGPLLKSRQTKQRDHNEHESMRKF